MIVSELLRIVTPKQLTIFDDTQMLVATKLSEIEFLLDKEVIEWRKENEDVTIFIKGKWINDRASIRT